MTTKKMFGKMLTSRLLKVMSIIIAACMLVTLTACGTTVSQQDARQTTTEYSTVDEEEGREPQNPEQTVDDGYWHDEDPTEEPTSSTEEPTSEPTTEQRGDENPPTGQYTYTVYGDIQLTMDVNIDDYIWTNGDGQEVFGLFDFALDLGWWPGTAGSIPVDPSSFGATRAGWNEIYDRQPGCFFCPAGSGYIAFQYEAFDELAPNYSSGQVRYYSFYGVDGYDGLNDSLYVHVEQHYDDVQYIVPVYSGLVASRDDIIVLAYAFSSFANDASVNPLAGTGLDRYRNGGDYWLQ